MTQETNPQAPKTISLTPHPQGGVNAQSAGAGRPSRPLAMWTKTRNKHFSPTWELASVCLDYVEAADILGCTRGYISRLLANSPSFTKWGYRVTRATMQQCLKHLPHAAIKPMAPPAHQGADPTAIGDKVKIGALQAEITQGAQNLATVEGILADHRNESKNKRAEFQGIIDARDNTIRILEGLAATNSKEFQRINKLLLEEREQTTRLEDLAVKRQAEITNLLSIASQNRQEFTDQVESLTQANTRQCETIEAQVQRIEQIKAEARDLVPAGPLPVSLTALKALGATLTELTTQHSPTTRKALDAYLLSLLEGMGLTLEAKTAQDPTPATLTLGSIRHSAAWLMESNLILGRWYDIEDQDSSDYMISDEGYDHRWVAKSRVNQVSPMSAAHNNAAQDKGPAA